MKKWVALLMAALLICSWAYAEEIGTRMQVVNCKEWITLREEPDTQAQGFARIPLGENNVTVIDYDCGEFAEVTYKGVKGYALKEYLAVYDSYEGTEIDPGKKERYNVNLFLSNFSEQYFGLYEGCYCEDCYRSETLVDFAINHIWFNKQDLLEWGEWDEYNVRVPADVLSVTSKKYLNRVPENLVSDYFALIDGYFYWTETGGHVNDGFVCLDKLIKLDEGRYGVYFRVYGAGENWENDVCYSTPDEVFTKYWNFYEGHAVINLNGGDLSSREGWYLERYAVKPAT